MIRQDNTLKADWATEKYGGVLPDMATFLTVPSQPIGTITTGAAHGHIWAPGSLLVAPLRFRLAPLWGS